MLVGVKESDMESIERQVSDIVLIDDRVSCSLNCLLTMSDPMYYAYNAGRIRLFQVLMRDESQTPLEAAYSWSICCTSAVVGQLEFLNKSFKSSAKISCLADFSLRTTAAPTTLSC